MTKEVFYKYWTLTYPKVHPIPHLFKEHFPERWFRIHSLPESKRYAENESEWDIILERQNNLITELLGNCQNVFLITGEYCWGYERTPHITKEQEIFKKYQFVIIDDVCLNDCDTTEDKVKETYSPAFAEIIWSIHKHDALLREIAVDNIRGFFLSIEKNILVAPYDGGVDIIVNDSMTKDFLKEKYKQWLSEREDGL